MKRPLIFPLLALLALAAASHAQQPAAGNRVLNGGFEQITSSDNLWDGVDSDGYLAGWRESAMSLNPNGGASDIAMPVSVSCADLNGDKIMDIVTADPTGYYRIYFGSGTPQNPKYTQGELVPLFLSPAAHFDPSHRVPKIALFDWGKRGQADLLIGRYNGELALIPNTGSSQAPEFRQPNDVGRVLIPTSKTNRLWCILPAPAVWDFDGDGKADVLLGEGSYSANSIHLLLNKGSGSVPKFDEEGRHYLVYGDGREVLTPAVVDYNGDGLMDVVAGGSDGKVCVYLNPGSWKPGMEFKFASDISFGGATALGGVVAPCVADINQDGLFDLIIGKNNGRLALAINKGTKQEPKFDRPVEIQGEDLWKRDINIPSGWSVDDGHGRGNLFAVATSVNATEDKEAQPAEGGRALKFGYLPSFNKIVKFTPVSSGTPDQRFPGTFFPWFWGYNPGDATWVAEKMSTTTFGAMRVLNNLVPGKTYTLSLKVKGRNFTGRWVVGALGRGLRSPRKITRMDRGAAKVEEDAAHEEIHDEGTIAPSPAWTTVTHTLDLKFKKESLLNNPDGWAQKYPGMKAPFYKSVLCLNFEVRPPDGVVYIDDVVITEKP